MPFRTPRSSTRGTPLGLFAKHTSLHTKSSRDMRLTRNTIPIEWVRELSYWAKRLRPVLSQKGDLYDIRDRILGVANDSGVVVGVNVNEVEIVY